jgi:hypothetical protein
MSTGNIRTPRLSSSGGRTFMSMIANSDSSAGSVRRMYSYYKEQNHTSTGFYKTVFGINRGQFRNRLWQFIGPQ